MKRRKRKGWVLICLLAVLAFACGKNVDKWQESREYKQTLATEDAAAETTASRTEENATDENGTETSDQEQKQIRKFTDEFDQARYEIGLDAAEYDRLLDAQTGRYAFDSLNAAEKYWYVDIYTILNTMSMEIELDTAQNPLLGTADIDRIFQCVLNDHPELFYVDGYTYTHYTLGEDTVRITLSGTYTMNAQEADIRRAQIDQYVQECLAGISPAASQYEKVKYIYDYIITRTEYNQQAAENQNICSVFIGRESVCQGYAKAAQYLLNLLNIKTTLVIGKVDNGQGHAWNLVQIDGSYYYVDTTWGDASYQEAEAIQYPEEGGQPTINYDYLCVTTEQLCRTHTIQNVVPMPECTAMDANYYIMENAYFTDYNEEQLKTLFTEAYNRGKTDVTLKCATADIYTTFLTDLIENQKIFRYLNSSDGTIAYADNAVQMSLTFWLTED